MPLSQRVENFIKMVNRGECCGSGAYHNYMGERFCKMVAVLYLNKIDGLSSVITELRGSNPADIMKLNLTTAEFKFYFEVEFTED